MTVVTPEGRFAGEQANRLLGRLAAEIARTIKSHFADEVDDLRLIFYTMSAEVIHFRQVAILNTA
jgi:hypothetical protein